MPWLVCGLAALTPFWAILGRLGMKKGRRPLPTPMISRLLINCGPFPPQMLPFPAEIAGFPDLSRLIPVYPAFLKYVVSVQFGPNGDNVPSKKKFLTEVKQGSVCKTIWFRTEVGDNQEAKKEVKALVPDDPFATPKPERLIERIIYLSTKPGDIVLDSFLGSGTTIAVAHKMNRRWIGIELGNHAYTHCKVRMDKVVDGEQGGISKAVDWHGGGGYHFYELAESLLVQHPVLPIMQVNPNYTFEMLCEAICKIEGFKYTPKGVFHGYSSEKRFIHITKEFINAEYVKSVSATLSDDQSLLIYGTKIQSDLYLPDNVEVKKIPKDLLQKCSFESEVR